MTAAGVKETLLENQQSFFVGKMDMKGKQKRPPLQRTFFPSTQPQHWLQQR